MLICPKMVHFRNIPAYAGKAGLARRGLSSREKHPRIRGESPLTPVILYLFTETSPHTRGKRNHRVPKGPPQRNIPAYAGKAYQTRQWQKGSEKHPRIRGESRLNILKVCRLIETSPHTRGKRISGRTTEERRRNIPAYAGKAHRRSAIASAVQKHPRIRGESRKPPRIGVARVETSPHTRGKLGHTLL